MVQCFLCRASEPCQVCRGVNAGDNAGNDVFMCSFKKVTQVLWYPLVISFTNAATISSKIHFVGGGNYEEKASMLQQFFGPSLQSLRYLLHGDQRCLPGSMQSCMCGIV